MLKPIGL